MKKDIALIGGLFLIIIVLLFFGKGFTSTSAVSTNKSTANSTPVTVVKTLKIKSLALKVIVADSAGERKKGLSNRDNMSIDDGMFFVFEKNAVYPIWMKDMKFAIDIIWIGTDRKIVDIVQNVPPELGKKDRDLKIYTPKAEAMYVLEVNAGLTALNGIFIGDTVEF